MRKRLVVQQFFGVGKCVANEIWEKISDEVLEASLCSFEELESNVLGTNDLKQRILVEMKENLIIFFKH